MSKQEQTMGSTANFSIWAGSILGIMFLFLPSFALADVTQNVVTGSRALATSYQNTTGYPLFVSVTTNNSLSTSNATCYSDSTTNPTVAVMQSNTFLGGNIACFMVVPFGYYYQVKDLNGGGAVSLWVEWVMASTSSSGGSTSTVISGTVSVDNPVFDIFMGMVMFFIAMIFPIWFFKRPWT